MGFELLLYGASAVGILKKVAAKKKQAVPATPAAPAPATPSNPFYGLETENIPRYISTFDVYQIAAKVRAQYNLLPSAKLLTTIATIESGDHRNPGRHDRMAYRYEPHISDASYGLMQSLYQTNARWLYDVRGYRGRKLNAPERLYSPETAIYFGAAYIDWLMRSYGGTEEQIARRYNGGPRGDRYAATEAYWQKYQIAQANLREIRVFG